MTDGREFYGGAWGRELKADNSRAGVVDDGNMAWPERIAQAAVQWPQADVADFEPVGKRRWRDKVTGVEYKEESGAPLLGIGTDSTRFVAPVPSPNILPARRRTTTTADGVDGARPLREAGTG